MNNKGITLIALIITIIVLLILAGVALTAIAGEDGILNRASESLIRTENGQVYEAVVLKEVNSNWDLSKSSQEDYLNYFDEQGLITYDDENDVWILDAQEIADADKTGKGSLDAGDVYIIEERDDGSFWLNYINNNSEEYELGEVFNSITVAEKEIDYSTIFITDGSGNITGVTDEGKTYETLYVPDSINGETITSISGMNYCDNLVSVSLPNTISTIYYGTFLFNSNLTEINFRGTMEEWNSITKEGGWAAYANKLSVVHCTDGDVAL